MAKKYNKKNVQMTAADAWQSSVESCKEQIDFINAKIKEATTHHMMKVSIYFSEENEEEHRLFGDLYVRNCIYEYFSDNGYEVRIDSFQFQTISIQWTKRLI